MNGKGGGAQEKVWRDLGLEALLRGVGGSEGDRGAGSVNVSGSGSRVGVGEGSVRRDGEGVVGRTLEARRRVEGTAGARLRG
jgi:hypothetical protein